MHVGNNHADDCPGRLNKTQSKTKQTHPLKAFAALCIVKTKMKKGLHWAAERERESVREKIRKSKGDENVNSLPTQKPHLFS